MPLPASLKNPSLALNIGYLLKKCALILHSEGMIEDDERKQKNGKIFKELYDAEWADRISSGALQTLDINKSNQMKLLPLCEDVQTHFVHVKVKSAQLRTKVKAHSRCHGDCVHYIQCEIIMFNRKRGGEVQRMKVTDVQNAMKETLLPDKEMEQCLSSTEVQLRQIMKRVEFRGKFDLRVALVLTPNMLDNIWNMLDVRVLSEFVVTTCFVDQILTNRSGADSLREFVQEVKLQQPQQLNWTGMRKHLATLSQVFELSETSQDQLAQFMEHSIRVHRSFYRLPMDLLQRAKVAKVLMAANLGRHHPPEEFEDTKVDADGE